MLTSPDRCVEEEELLGSRFAHFYIYVYIKKKICAFLLYKSSFFLTSIYKYLQQFPTPYLLSAKLCSRDFFCIFFYNIQTQIEGGHVALLHFSTQKVSLSQNTGYNTRKKKIISGKKASNFLWTSLTKHFNSLKCLLIYLLVCKKPPPLPPHSPHFIANSLWELDDSLKLAWHFFCPHKFGHGRTIGTICQLACSWPSASQSCLPKKTSIWRPAEWMPGWIYSSSCCFVKSLGVKPLYPPCPPGWPLRIRDQVVETFVTFGQSKSQSACWIEAQTKEGRR